MFLSENSVVFGAGDKESGKGDNQQYERHDGDNEHCGEQAVFPLFVRFAAQAGEQNDGNDVEGKLRNAADAGNNEPEGKAKDGGDGFPEIVHALDERGVQKDRGKIFADGKRHEGDGKKDECGDLRPGFVRPFAFRFGYFL